MKETSSQAALTQRKLSSQQVYHKRYDKLALFLSFFLSQSFRMDEEPVDPKKYLEDSFKPKCVKHLLEYQ
ncbi:hypothetical protein FRX31_010179, partial [Thalictrum thalictroides]